MDRIASGNSQCLRPGLVFVSKLNPVGSSAALYPDDVSVSRDSEAQLQDPAELTPEKPCGSKRTVKWVTVRPRALAREDDLDFFQPKKDAGRLSALRASTLSSVSTEGSTWLDQQSAAKAMRTVEEELRLAPRPFKQLSDEARATLDKVWDDFAKNSGRSAHHVTDEMRTLLDNFYAPASMSKHAGYYAKWTAYADQMGIPHQPIDPWDLAAFLAGAAVGDRTYSPTANRVAAIAAITKLSGFPNQCQEQIVRMITRGIQRRLGVRNTQKEPLTREHVFKLYIQFASDPGAPLSDVLMVLWVTISFEATLRFDDLSSIFWGGFIRTCEYVRVFLIGTKTDQTLQGQWAVFAVAPNPDSAYQLWLRAISMLGNIWKSLPIFSRQQIVHKVGSNDPDRLPLAYMPFCCTLENVGPRQLPFPKVASVDAPEFRESVLPYHKFSKHLHRMIAEVGLDPSLFGTHSTRRGAVTQADAFGVPDRLKRCMGRWRSDRMLGVYIDRDQTLDSLLKACSLDQQLSASLLDAWETSESGPASLKPSFAQLPPPVDEVLAQPDPVILNSELVGLTIVMIWDDASVQKGRIIRFFPKGWGRQKYNFDVVWSLDDKIRPVKLEVSEFKSSPEGLVDAPTRAWTLLNYP